MAKIHDIFWSIMKFDSMSSNFVVQFLVEVQEPIDKVRRHKGVPFEKVCPSMMRRCRPCVVPSWGFLVQVHHPLRTRLNCRVWPQVLFHSDITCLLLFTVSCSPSRDSTVMDCAADVTSQLISLWLHSLTRPSFLSGAQSATSVPRTGERLVV